MTNPRVVVPHIEELIVLSHREKSGTLHPEDAKRLNAVRNDLTRYFERIESDLMDLRSRVK